MTTVRTIRLAGGLPTPLADTEQISFRIAPADRLAIKALCVTKGTTLNILMNDMVDAYLTEHLKETP